MALPHAVLSISFERAHPPWPFLDNFPLQSSTTPFKTLSACSVDVPTSDVAQIVLDVPLTTPLTLKEACDVVSRLSCTSHNTSPQDLANASQVGGFFFLL